MGVYVDGAWSGIGKTVQRIEQIYIEAMVPNNSGSDVMTPGFKQYDKLIC